MDGRTRRQLLIELGPAKLADALLGLAPSVPTIDDLVEHLTNPSTTIGTIDYREHSSGRERVAALLSDESVGRFRQHLADVTGGAWGYGWEPATALARELEYLLRDIADSVVDPEQGLALVASFFEADEETLGACDDSSGFISDVFRGDATDLFVRYARACTDKTLPATLLVTLYLGDEYSAREGLIDIAMEALGEPGVRALIAAFQDQAEREGGDYARRHCSYAIESLARQVGDAKLFEETRMAAWQEPASTTAYIDIAEVYLETGSAETALAWLERIPVDETYSAGKRDALLLAAYGALGRVSEQAEVAWRVFRSRRTLASLDLVLAIIGEERREVVLKDEAALILADEKLSLTDAEFLVGAGRPKDAGRYLLDHGEQIDGNQYTRLPSLAKLLEAEHPLAASVIYRALLDCILGPGRSSAYEYAAGYLRAMDRMAERITEWERFGSHAEYVEGIRRDHKRKYGFWGRYNG